MLIYQPRPEKRFKPTQPKRHPAVGASSCWRNCGLASAGGSLALESSQHEQILVAGGAGNIDELLKENKKENKASHEHG